MNDQQSPALRNAPAQPTCMVPRHDPGAAATLPAAYDPSGNPNMGPLAVIVYSGSENGSLLLDRSAGEYVELPGLYSVTPSPDGARALVYTRRSDDLWFGIWDSLNRNVRRIDGGCRGTLRVSTAGWSRAGRKILITESAEDRSGFSVVDADNLDDVDFVRHDGIATLDGLGLRYVWTPNENEIALTQSRGIGPTTEPRVTGIQFYDRTGEPGRLLPATAALTRESCFSPDGTRMALQTNPPFGDSIEIVGVTDGHPHESVRLPEDRPPPRLIQFICWADDHHLIVRDSTNLGLWIVCTECAEFRAVVLPNTYSAGELHIGSSHGLKEERSSITFGPECHPPGADHPRTS